MLKATVLASPGGKLKAGISIAPWIALIGGSPSLVGKFTGVAQTCVPSLSCGARIVAKYWLLTAAQRILSAVAEYTSLGPLVWNNPRILAGSKSFTAIELNLPSLYQSN